jgi:hypothetical protein
MNRSNDHFTPIACVDHLYNEIMVQNVIELVLRSDGFFRLKGSRHGTIVVSDMFVPLMPAFICGHLRNC